MKKDNWPEETIKYLTDPDERKKRKRKTEIKARINNKKLDTGLEKNYNK